MCFSNQCSWMPLPWIKSCSLKGRNEAAARFSLGCQAWGQVLLNAPQVRDLVVPLVPMGQKPAPAVPAATSLCSWKFGVSLFANVCNWGLGSSTGHSILDETAVMQVPVSIRWILLRSSLSYRMQPTHAGLSTSLPSHALYPSPFLAVVTATTTYLTPTITHTILLLFYLCSAVPRTSGRPHKHSTPNLQIKSSFYSEKGSHWHTQAGLELIILLTQLL